MEYSYIIKPTERGYKIMVFREIDNKPKLVGVTHCTDFSMVCEILHMINGSNAFFSGDAEDVA
jgi:hypothetical protein